MLFTFYSILICVNIVGDLLQRPCACSATSFGLQSVGTYGLEHRVRRQFTSHIVHAIFLSKINKVVICEHLR